MTIELYKTLNRAESFIAGFEGDEQQEGVDELLHDLRETLSSLEEELFPVPDWRHKVVNGHTQLGYVEWRNHQIEAARNE